jgi:hypothetical protein
MREAMAILGPLLRGEPVDVRGEVMSASIALEVGHAPEVPVLIAALGERMLEIAGRAAAGTILWMAGPRTIASHVVPTLCRAASEAGRPEPRVAAGVFVTLTSNVNLAREKLGRLFTMYRQMPSYRAMMEREGSDDVRDYVLMGDERALDAGLDRLRDAGVTDLEAYVVKADPGDDLRALAYLADRAEGARR